MASEGDADGAVPPPLWRPPEDEAAGLRLEHAAGQRLDADWVRAQFAGNMGSGDTVAKAIGLVQLINRAFLTAGFFNPGWSCPSSATSLRRARPAADLRPAERGRGRRRADRRRVGRRPIGRSQPGYIRQRFGSTRRLPLSAYEIEREFRLLAEDPAIRTVTADLRPGTRPGEASLNLIIYPEERFDFYSGAANDRSPSVGGERLFSGGYARSLLAGGDLLTSELGITDGLEDGQLAYSIPLFLAAHVAVAARRLQQCRGHRPAAAAARHQRQGPLGPGRHHPPLPRRAADADRPRGPLVAVADAGRRRPGRPPLAEELPVRRALLLRARVGRRAHRLPRCG